MDDTHSHPHPKWMRDAAQPARWKKLHCFNHFYRKLSPSLAGILCLINQRLGPGTWYVLGREFKTNKLFVWERMAMATMVEVISCSSSVFLRSRTQVMYTRLCDGIHFRLCIRIHTGTNYVRCGYEDFPSSIGRHRGCCGIFWGSTLFTAFWWRFFLRRAQKLGCAFASHCRQLWVMWLWNCPGCDQTSLVVYRFGMQFVFFISGDDFETCPEFKILNPA